MWVTICNDIWWCKITRRREIALKYSCYNLWNTILFVCHMWFSSVRVFLYIIWSGLTRKLYGTEFACAKWCLRVDLQLWTDLKARLSLGSYLLPAHVESMVNKFRVGLLFHIAQIISETIIYIFLRYGTGRRDAR